jgi:hypothetical protein
VILNIGQVDKVEGGLKIDLTHFRTGGAVKVPARTAYNRKLVIIYKKEGLL